MINSINSTQMKSRDLIIAKKAQRTSVREHFKRISKPESSFGFSMKKFMKEETGAVLILFVVVMLPVITLLAFCVEFGRYVYYDTRLAYAIDAATIAAARYNVADVQTNGAKFFAANFPTTGLTDITLTTPSFTLSSDNKQVSSSVTGTMKTIFTSWLNVSTLKLAASSQVQRALQNAEIALVLDNTGSMASNGKMDGLKNATTSLLNTLYGSANTVQGLSVSIVPYVAVVNIGNTRTSWLSNPSLITTKTAFPSDAPWAGCVYAIDTGATMDTDDPPSALRKWPVYQVPTTYQVYGKNVIGDNDWTISKNKLKVMTASVPTVGPNRSCGLPIVPLINNKATLMATVNAMQPVSGGGTFGNLGLVWGWNTISPKWTGLWGTSNSPQAYGQVIKSIVIVTDGENNWFDDPNYAPTGDPTAYGRVSNGLLGTTDITKTRTYIDNRLLDLCTKIKNQGIQIFTVTFQVSDSLAISNYKQCATKPEWAFQANNSADLNTYFINIGNVLQSIRVTK